MNSPLQLDMFGAPPAPPEKPPVLVREYERRAPSRPMKDPPIARRRDPETSHYAAEQLTESGKRKSQKEILLALIKANPGLTAWEYEQLWQPCWKRISDLKSEGLIFAGEVRWPDGQPKPQVTLWPTPGPEDSPSS